MTLSLGSLQEYQQEPFDLGNGSTIYFRNAKQFDVQEYAAWNRLQRDLQGIGEKRKKAQTEQHYSYVEDKNLTLCRELIALVLPDIPKDTMDNLTASETDRLAAVCLAVASGRYHKGLVDEDVAREIENHYPSLPGEFIRSLTRNQAQKLLPVVQDETAVSEGN